MNVVHVIHTPKSKVDIGIKYTGKRELVLNTRTGEYQESLPKIEGHELNLQLAFISKPKGIQWAKLVSIVVVGFKPLTTSTISPLGSDPITRSGTQQPPHAIWRR